MQLPLLLAPLLLAAASPATALHPRAANGTTPANVSSTTLTSAGAETTATSVLLLTPSANLSTTASPSSQSRSLVLLTTSLPGGQQATITSFVGGEAASPTGAGGAGGAGATGTGITQPGAAPQGAVGDRGAWGALVVALGMGALVL